MNTTKNGTQVEVKPDVQQPPAKTAEEALFGREVKVVAEPKPATTPEGA